MSEPLKIGLIGCGRAAERYYLPAIGRHAAKMRLMAVADPRPERTLLAKSLVAGCLTFDSVEMMLQKADIDGVIVTSSPETHVPITIKALEAGLSVLVEKPLGTSSEQVQDLEECTSRSRGIVMVGFNQRHWEPVQQLERILRQKDLSDQISADLTMTVNNKEWAPVSGVSNPLEDLGAHLLDLSRFLLRREIMSVAANQSADGAVQLRVQLTGGINAACRVAYSSLTRESIDIRLGHDRYWIRMGSDRITPAAGVTRALFDMSDAVRRRLRGRRSSLHYSHERQLLRFLEHVRGNQDAMANVADGVAAVRAIEAAKLSIIRQGQEVLV